MSPVYGLAENSVGLTFPPLGRGPLVERIDREAQMRELFHDGWVRSGDRAYMAGGDIFITGRVKDIIIRAGRNIYPHEVEAAVGELPGMRKGGVAVFGTRDEASGTERLVVLAETRETDAAAREQLRQRANDVAASILGEPADEIVLVQPRTVPKTSSGKVRRSSAKELYERGQLGMRQSAMWWQLARLWLAGTGPRVVRFGRLAVDRLYAAWGGLVV